MYQLRRCTVDKSNVAPDLTTGVVDNVTSPQAYPVGGNAELHFGSIAIDSTITGAKIGELH